MQHREWDHPDYRQALDLQRSAGLIDLHVDFLLQWRLFGYRPRRRHRALLLGQPCVWHADVPRMRDAGYAGACLGIHFLPVESEWGWRAARNQIDDLDRLARDDPRLLRGRDAADFTAARAGSRLCLIPGVEGAHILAGRIGRVEDLARRGVAYLTLTHFSANRFATPSMGRGANERDGLGRAGRDLVRELNRVGIAVDCAHVNTPGVLDACRTSRAPVLVTHTGVKAVHPHRRNLADLAIDAVAATGGVIGIMASPVFLAGTRRATTEVVVRHIDHVVQRAGIAHAAIGSDYDGWIPIPSDQRDCRDVVKVTDGLMRLGYGESELKMVLGDNFLRVLDQTRRLAR